MRFPLALIAFLLLLLQVMNATAQTIAPQDWAAYKQRFVGAEGRVIDDGNGGISHSEGQGYGMLLAHMAGNRSDFDMIWSFTHKELLLRDDGLAMWKWSPSATPHVTDANNATDGDILIAYALALAGKGWNEAEFTRQATGLIRAIAAHMLIERDGRRLLLPGGAGFSADDRTDGPVVNLSYWIFEAFSVFAELDPATDWRSVAADGLALLEMLTREEDLPPEWVSMASRPKPAHGFDAEFSYNALRIPLYLARSDLQADALLRNMARKMSTDSGVAITDLEHGKVKQVLTDTGYRIIPALARCKADGKPVPDELRDFAPTLYYPSTLHLLALARIDALGGCR